MSDAHYFDEDTVFESQADEAVQDMARRQFGVSLAVGFALLAIAGLTVVKTSHAAPMETAARHRIIHVEAPQPQMAQPAMLAPTKG